MAIVGLPYTLQLHYDEEGDVLYASIDKPIEALSREVETDILLRYVPPHDTPVGVTIIGFLERFPCPAQVALRDHERHVVADILERYPRVPKA